MANASEEIDPYHKWLGIPKSQQPPTFYRLLGIEPFEHNAVVIDAAASRQVAYLHQLTSGPHRRLTQKLMNEIAQARRILMDEPSREKYDAKLRAKLAALPNPPEPEAKTEVNAKPDTDAFPAFPAIDFGAKKTPAQATSSGAKVAPKTKRPVAPSDATSQEEPAKESPKRGRASKAWWQKNDWRIHVGISVTTIVIAIIYLMFWGPGSQRRHVPEGNFEQPKIQNFDDKFND